MSLVDPLGPLPPRGGHCLGGGFEVVGEVHEEIQPCPLLDLVHALDKLFGVVVAFACVALVGVPEADGGCGCGVAFATTNLQHDLVEIPRCGYIRPIGIVGFFGREGAVAIVHLRTHCAGYDVEVFTIGSCLQGTFEGAPHSTVEVALNLWYEVYGVEQLLIGCRGVGTRSRRQEVPLGVVVCTLVVATDVPRVERADDVHLTILCEDVAGHIFVVVSPTNATEMRTVERIGHPVGCACRLVVTNGVVTVGVGLGAVVEGVSEEIACACALHHGLRATHHCGHFEPRLSEGGSHGRLIAARASLVIISGAPAGYSSVTNSYNNIVNVSSSLASNSCDFNC